MKHLNIHAIGFKKGMVTCNPGTAQNQEKALELQYLLMRFGYVLSKEAYDMMSQQSDEFIEQYAEAVNDFLEDFIGSKRGYTLQDIYDEKVQGVYTSLPSFIHLLYDNSYLDPDTDNPLIKEYVMYKAVEYATIDKFKMIFTQLVSINTSLTPQDYETVKWFAGMYGSENTMPKTIPFKENLCMLAALMMDVPVHTSTDVLRIAMFLSNGHTELRLPPKEVRASAWTTKRIPNPERDNFKFKSFRRAERRYLLGLLDKVAQPKEMVLKRGQWLRLGEKLHPGDYKKMFAKSYNAFHKLRNDKVYTWYSDVDNAFKTSFSTGLDKLAERPGEFARRLDSLIRDNSSTNQTRVLEKFLEIVPKISNKVLWELYRHFNARISHQNLRMVTIPGARKPVRLPVLDPLPEQLVEDIQFVIFEGIKAKFESLPPLGNVYIDEELKKIPAPVNMRTMNDALLTVARGTRMPLDAHKKMLRPFIYWTAGKDIDLSVTFYSKSGGKMICSFSSPRPGNNVVHSGDVIPRHKGEWREYIDIPYAENTYDYAVVTIRNFSGGPLQELGVIAGLAEFDNKKPGNAWNPQAVEISHKMQTAASSVVLYAIDFNAKEWIPIDQDQAGIPVEIQQDSTVLMEYFLGSPKVSAYDILKLHTEARGTEVDEIEEAETVFTFNDFSTSYETLAEYML